MHEAPVAPERLEMWFDFASPYSYLSIMRLEPLAQAAGVRVDYVPFMLGPVFRAQGLAQTPFRLFPDKGAYMLRDVARRAERFGVPYRPPSAFPRLSLLLARIALLVRDEPWYLAFCRAVFQENFVHDRDLQSPEVIGAVLRRLGAPDSDLIARAGTGPVKQALKALMETAHVRHVFGAPTFFVGSEMFWGDDRVEDALAWTQDAKHSLNVM